MTLNQAIETAKQEAVDFPRWLRAIERAAAGLQSGEPIVTLPQHDALATSANGSYRVNGHCECEAARRGHIECHHRAAVRLVEMMEVVEPVATKAATRDAIIADIKRLWPAKFPTDNLADALMYRFHVNYLEALADGWLQDILAAIAM